MSRSSVRLPTNYAEQTYDSPYWIVRYPHRKRYRLAVNMVMRHRPNSLLDYGAGDGHVLAELAARGGARPSRIVAYEPDAEAAELARARVAELWPDASTEVLRSPDLRHERFDFILCLGVLEHMPLPERERFFNVCAEHLTEHGRCLIDVPVEIGLSLAVKEVGRLTLKGRTPEYSLRDLVRAATGCITFDPARFNSQEVRTWLHFHTGFDYRLLEQELRARFWIIERFTSPFGALPAGIFNQEIFFLVGEPPATTSDNRS